MNNILESWKKFFLNLNIKSDIDNLLNIAYSGAGDGEVLPDRHDVLNLFKILNPEDVRVVIVGQDPYHTPGVANGIAFSTKSKKTPPSLKNIFKELKNDLGIDRKNNDLTDWVIQGVLLINSVFTVKAGEPNSHKNIGWQGIVEKILKKLYENNNKIIFCLWGNNAKYLYNNLSISSKNLIISQHPSPFSYKKGFEGSKPFSKINKLILENNMGKEIDW